MTCAPRSPHEFGRPVANIDGADLEPHILCLGLGLRRAFLPDGGGRRRELALQGLDLPERIRRFGGSLRLRAPAAPRMSRKASVSLIISIPMKRLIIDAVAGGRKRRVGDGRRTNT